MFSLRFIRNTNDNLCESQFLFLYSRSRNTELCWFTPQKPTMLQPRPFLPGAIRMQPHGWAFGLLASWGAQIPHPTWECPSSGPCCASKSSFLLMCTLHSIRQLKYLGLCYPHEKAGRDLASWLCPGLTLGVVAIWGVNEQTDLSQTLSHSPSLCLSNKFFLK